MSSETRNRQPRGVSTGGQFAAEHKQESPVALVAPAADPYAKARADLKEYSAAHTEFQDATELSEVAGYLRANHPEAVAFRPTFDSNDAAVRIRNADGTEAWMDDADDDSPMFTGAGNKAAGRTSDEQGWIKVADTDIVSRTATLRFSAATQALEAQGPRSSAAQVFGPPVPAVEGSTAEIQQKKVEHLAQIMDVTTFTDDAGNSCDVIIEDGKYTLAVDLSDQDGWRTGQDLDGDLAGAVARVQDQHRTSTAASGAGLSHYGHAFEVRDVERGGDGEWAISYSAEDGSEDYEMQWSPVHDLRITTIDGLDMTLDAQTVAEDILGREDGDAEAFFRDAEARYQSNNAS